MRLHHFLLAGGLLLAFLSFSAGATDKQADKPTSNSQQAASSKKSESENSKDAKPANAEKYLLCYHFLPGETLRWKVIHRARVRATIRDETQTTESVSVSVKVWRVKEVNEDSISFEHSVESVRMRQKTDSGEEITYNSETDKEPPLLFQSIIGSVGTTLAEMTISRSGTILKRRYTEAQVSPAGKGQITIPLPKEPIAVGHSWSHTETIDVPRQSGGSFKKVKLLQKLTLKQVKTGIATIEISNHVLTPIHSPALEAKLVEREKRGTVKFDIEAGRIRSLQYDLDKRIVGFSSNASSLHYLTRFTEELLPAEKVEVAGTSKADKTSKK